MMDRSIPGQMSEEELHGIEDLARGVPDGGCIVETGSLFGLSSFTWATSAPPKCSVYCIDPWVREPWIVELVESQYPGCPPFGREAFEKFTSSCKNIVPMQGYSPVDFLDWSRPVDVFFDDAVHQNPALHNNLMFWLQFMKPNGVVCGHDHTPQWPDVIQEAETLARNVGSAVQTRETLWWVRLPETFDAQKWKLDWWTKAEWRAKAVARKLLR
jgi:hypothetical protein